jgi:CRISPR-associated protein Cas2
MDIYDEDEDSLRFYFLGKRGHQRVEHIGAKPVGDPLRSPLIL